jgi:hypothetical protein
MTAAQARLERALQQLIEMDPVLRRAGAAGGLDPATAMKFDAALCELDEASSAAPDTPLPQEQLLQLQHILRASCERGRDAAPFRSAFAAAGVRGLLIGFLSPTLPHQGGHRRQQVSGAKLPFWIYPSPPKKTIH